MGTKLKAGVIGLGILGSQHAEYLHKHDGVEVVAVADLRAEVGGAVAARLGAQSYTDCREMLSPDGKLGEACELLAHWNDLDAAVFAHTRVSVQRSL